MAKEHVDLYLSGTSLHRWKIGRVRTALNRVPSAERINIPIWCEPDNLTAATQTFAAIIEALSVRGELPRRFLLAMNATNTRSPDYGRAFIEIEK